MHAAWSSSIRGVRGETMCKLSCKCLSSVQTSVSGGSRAGSFGGYFTKKISLHRWKPFFSVLSQTPRNTTSPHTYPRKLSSVSLCKRSLYETTHVPPHTTHTRTLRPTHTPYNHKNENIAIMADQLNMNNLSLQESQHAPKPGHQQNGGYGQGRSAYIPPHMRGARGGPAPGPPAFDGPPPMGGPNGFGPPPGVQAK